jgi:hypothetical protein
MSDTEPSKRPLTLEEKVRDRQINRYLDRKIVRNFAGEDAPERRKEAIRTTATRIFSLDTEKISAAAQGYLGEIKKQQQQIKKSKGGA